VDVETERRAATAEEAKAIASPLRLRILRLCLDRPLTNKQIAQALDRDPASVLHHVRKLVQTGFLAAEGERRGTRGAREVPYRATGKSWVLDVVDEKQGRAKGIALVEAFLDGRRRLRGGVVGSWQQQRFRGQLCQSSNGVIRPTRASRALSDGGTTFWLGCEGATAL
jgi:DNA-binding transcriptional ArsR family regulator